MPPPPGMPGESQSGSGQHELAAASEPTPVPVAPKPMSKKKISVRALRAGWIHNERKVENDRFDVSPQELGSWMECLDPVEQKKHLANIAAKKKLANHKAIKDHERDIQADE